MQGSAISCQASEIWPAPDMARESGRKTRRIHTYTNHLMCYADIKIIKTLTAMKEPLRFQKPELSSKFQCMVLLFR